MVVKGMAIYTARGVFLIVAGDAVAYTSRDNPSSSTSEGNRRLPLSFTVWTLGVSRSQVAPILPLFATLGLVDATQAEAGTRYWDRISRDV